MELKSIGVHDIALLMWTLEIYYVLNYTQVFDRKAAGIAGRLDNVINGNDKKKSDSTASSSSSGSANHAMSPSLMGECG